MKKTLLSLALAGLAASAFANVSFYKSDVANLYTGGELSLNYTKNILKVNEKQAKEDTFTVKSTGSDLGFKVYTGGDFMVKDGLSAGYYVRYSGPRTLVDKVYNSKQGITVNNKDKNAPYYFSFNKGYVYLAYPTFGKVMLGKNISTVADSNMGTDLDTLEVKNAFGHENVPTSFNSVVYYSSPNFGGFNFNYSFGNSHENNYTRQNSFNGVYDFGGTKVSGLASFTNNYGNDGALYMKIKGFELAVENTDLMENLTLKAAYQIASTTKYQTEAPFGYMSKNTSKSFLVAANYEMNQYFKPYTGFVFNKSSLSDVNNNHGKFYSAYLGTSADLYKDDYVDVSAFVEGKYTKVKGVLPSTTKGSVEIKETIKAYALGVKVKF